MNSSVSRSVSTGWLLSGGLAVLAPAATGILGSPAQVATFCFAAVLGLALLSNAVIAGAAHALNRIARAHRESLARIDGDESVDDPHDQRIREHEATLSQRHQVETRLRRDHETNRCSQTDVIRAESLRLQAEITLLRHQKTIHATF